MVTFIFSKSKIALATLLLLALAAQNTTFSAYLWEEGQSDEGQLAYIDNQQMQILIAKRITQICSLIGIFAIFCGFLGHNPLTIAHGLSYTLFCLSTSSAYDHFNSWSHWLRTCSIFCIWVGISWLDAQSLHSNRNAPTIFTLGAIACALHWHIKALVHESTVPT